MTSVSSAVTMTAFEPVIVACNAYKSKQVSASSCVDCSSATSTHSSAVILEQVSSQVTYNALSCSISLYHCIVHSPTKNCMRPVLLKELHRNFLHCCMLCPPTRHFYWTVVLAHRFILSDFLMDGGDIRQIQHQPYHSVHQHTVLWTRQTASCANVLLLPFILLYQTYPINDTGWWSWDNVCKIYIFLKLPGKCGLVCFS